MFTEEETSQYSSVSEEEEEVSYEEEAEANGGKRDSLATTRKLSLLRIGNNLDSSSFSSPEAQGSAVSSPNFSIDVDEQEGPTSPSFSSSFMTKTPSTKIANYYEDEDDLMRRERVDRNACKIMKAHTKSVLATNPSRLLRRDDMSNKKEEGTEDVFPPTPTTKQSSLMSPKKTLLVVEAASEVEKTLHSEFRMRLVNLRVVEELLERVAGASSSSRWQDALLYHALDASKVMSSSTHSHQNDIDVVELRCFKCINALVRIDDEALSTFLSSISCCLCRSSCDKTYLTCATSGCGSDFNVCAKCVLKNERNKAVFRLWEDESFVQNRLELVRLLMKHLDREALLLYPRPDDQEQCRTQGGARRSTRMHRQFAVGAYRQI